MLVVPGAHALAASARQALLPYHDDLAVVYGRLDAVKRFAGRRCDGVYLVRPDGYIAARGTNKRLPRVLDYLGQLYGSAMTTPGS